jgi:lysophospholipase L1-like esterase
MKKFDHVKMVRNAYTGLVLALGVTLIAAPAVADGKPWVGTWASSPQPAWQGDFPLPTLVPFNLWNQTVRQKVRISLGGSKFRVVISNEYGKAPLTIDAVHIAMASQGASIHEGSSKPLTFSGLEKTVIPPGAPMISDPVDLAASSLSEISVSFYVSAPTPIDTFHWDAEQTSYIASGNLVSAPNLEDASTTTTRIFLSDVLVEADDGVKSVVAFGDSITDGAASGMDANARWPDFLAENLAPKNVAVLNSGISGARLLQSLMGENALARFDRDVLLQPNIKSVVILLGINDISWPGQTFAPSDPFLSKDQLAAGFRQLVARAHLRGVRVVMGTLTPFEDALKGSLFEGYYSKKRDALRMELNDWIRTSGEFDAVVDLDKLVQRPDKPMRIQDKYQADYLHLSPEGNKAVADALSTDVLFGKD